MSPIEKRILETLKQVGRAPSRFQLSIQAGVSYSHGYYIIGMLIEKGYIKIDPPDAKPRSGKPQALIPGDKS